MLPVAGKIIDILRRMKRLSKRERQVVKLVSTGRSNKQIATELGLSQKTVANHRASIIAKMKAENTADLVRLVTLAFVVAAIEEYASE